MSDNKNQVAVLSRFGIVVDRSSAVLFLGGEAALSKLLRELTFEYQAETSKGPRGPAAIYHAYQIVKGPNGPRLILPRSLYALFPGYRMRIPAGLPANHGHGNLLPHQTVIVNHLLDHEFSGESISAGLGVATLVLGTGQGKTFIAMGIAHSLGLRLLYIVKNKSLCRQAELDMEMFLGRNDSDPHWRVVVINSALRLADTEIDNFGMVVLDEVNEYCTPVFGQIFFRVQCRVLLAMTATLSRRDGFERAVHRFCTRAGTITFAKDIPGGTMSVSHFDKQAILLHYYAKPEFAQSLKHDSTREVFMHYMYKQYTSDPDRLAMVSQRLCELYTWRGASAECHTIYMFADEIDTLKAYRNHFEAHPPPGYSPEESILFVGGGDSDLIALARSSGRILWATYSYGSVGVSISRATAAISINGRVSGWEQCLGRITRAGSDPAIPRIFIDVIDSATCMGGQIRRRRDIYEKQGYKITNATFRAFNS